jgi:hypothetical protein
LVEHFHTISIKKKLQKALGNYIPCFQNWTESIGLIMNQELNQFDPLKKTEGSKKGAKTVPTGNLTTKTDSNFGF